MHAAQGLRTADGIMGSLRPAGASFNYLLLFYILVKGKRSNRRWSPCSDLKFKVLL